MVKEKRWKKVDENCARGTENNQSLFNKEKLLRKRGETSRVKSLRASK